MKIRSAREAAWLSLTHWRKMIRWVEKQDPDRPVNGLTMYMEISIDWYGEDCALCEWSRMKSLRIQENEDEYIRPCSLCPLFKRYGPCTGWRNVWWRVNASRTWGEWFKYGRCMEQQLEAVWKELK